MLLYNRLHVIILKTSRKRIVSIMINYNQLPKPDESLPKASALSSLPLHIRQTYDICPEPFKQTADSLLEQYDSGTITEDQFCDNLIDSLLDFCKA